MKTRLTIVWLCLLLLTGACSLDQGTQVNPSVGVTVSANPGTTFQEMIGFGGSIAWYCERVTNSNQKDAIVSLLFEDMGTDIVRFKNWYYPDDYPVNKSTDFMSDDNSKTAFEATNSLQTTASILNPNIKFILSSWGPPAGLKSNNSSRQGTLKKDGNNAFMYDAFATYWDDVLNNLSFTPDYISIQNEPSYVNAGWTTCEWAPTETGSLPGYGVAFDRVAQKILSRPNPPVMIGPESANIGDGIAGNTFGVYADVIRNHPSLGGYAWHPYNFNSTNTLEQTTPLLQMVAGYSNKPNLMTEYSDNLDWFATALFIQHSLVQANASGYVYWKMIWAPPTAGLDDYAMISINNDGGYTVTPYYYVMKHFAKAVDAGYERIQVLAGNNALKVVGFINPSKTSITIVAINLLSAPFDVEFSVPGSTVTSIEAAVSYQESFFVIVDNIVLGQPITVPGLSVSTFILGI